VRKAFKRSQSENPERFTSPENIAAMAAVGKPHKDKLNKTYAAFQSIEAAAAISQASNP